MRHIQKSNWSPRLNNSNVAELASALGARWYMWLLPAAVVFVLATVYAIAKAPIWEVSQGIYLRNEAAAASETPGKFSHEEELKDVQETLLELLRSRAVLEAALRDVGPSGSRAGSSQFPSGKDIERLRRRVKLAAPKGADFGSTEVFYVRVRHEDKQYAMKLATAICRHLDAQFRKLRTARAESMVRELEQAVSVARVDLEKATLELKQLEQQLGADLGELRSLNQWNAGETSLRQSVTQLSDQLRAAEQEQLEAEKLLAVLEQAVDDPVRLRQIPDAMLGEFSSLQSLKRGLIEAQLQTASLLGKMAAAHPLVQAARQAEVEILEHIRRELDGAIGTLRIKLQLVAQKKKHLQEELEAKQEQLAVLAGLRAEYANRLAEVETRTQLLKQAEEKLAEARIAKATAASATLLQPVDKPELSSGPVGLSRAMILLFGLLGAIATAAGMVVMTVEIPIEASPNSKNQPSVASTQPGVPRCAFGKLLIEQETREGTPCVASN